MKLTIKDLQKFDVLTSNNGLGGDVKFIYVCEFGGQYIFKRICDNNYLPITTIFLDRRIISWKRGNIELIDACEVCEGSGKTIGFPTAVDCDKCEGTGKIKEES